jgi:RNA polymerase sigma-70 factor (ECF subfamily)
MRHLEEQQFIERARALEPDAIQRLLEEYSPVVFHYFLRMGLQQVVAEELAQETFRRVWQALPGFQGHSMLKTWILSIARRVASRHFSKERARPSLVSLSESLEQFVELFDPAQVDPEEAFLSAERQYTLEQLLDLLPAEEREVVVLHGLEELSQREVARLMDRSVGWVNKVWQRACARIKRMFLRAYRTETSSDFFPKELVQWQSRTAQMIGM